MQEYEIMEGMFMNLGPYSQKQFFPFPPRLRDFVPVDHECHIINDVVEKLDLNGFYRCVPELVTMATPLLTVNIMLFWLLM